jgi:hypothetical protein
MNVTKRSNPRLAPFSITSDLLVVELSHLSPLRRRGFDVMLVTPGSPAAELLSTTIPSEREWGGWANTNFRPRSRVEQLGEQLCLPGHSPDHEHA